MMSSSSSKWLTVSLLMVSSYVIFSGPVLGHMRTNPHCYIIGYTSVADAGIGMVYYPLILVARVTGLTRPLIAYAKMCRPAPCP